MARLTVDVEDRDGRIEEHKKTIVDKLAEISETCSERDDTYVQWVFYFNRNRFNSKGQNFHYHLKGVTHTGVDI